MKLLATASRLDIEDFLQKKVYLEVHIHRILFRIYATFEPEPAYFAGLFINLESQVVTIIMHFTSRVGKYLLNTGV